MVSTGHVVHSGASGARNVDAIFFMLGWDRYGFDKMLARTRYTKLVFLHPVGSVGHLVHSVCPGGETSKHYISCSGGPGAVSIKSAPGTLCRTCVFASGWIYESHGAFQCVKGSSGTGMDSLKSALAHITPDLCFCI
jgi:hypothetical protein